MFATCLKKIDKMITIMFLTKIFVVHSSFLALFVQIKIASELWKILALFARKKIVSELWTIIQYSHILFSYLNMNN